MLRDEEVNQWHFPPRRAVAAARQLGWNIPPLDECPFCGYERLHASAGGPLPHGYGPVADCAFCDSTGQVSRAVAQGVRGCDLALWWYRLDRKMSIEDRAVEIGIHPAFYEAREWGLIGPESDRNLPICGHCFMPMDDSERFHAISGFCCKCLEPNPSWAGYHFECVNPACSRCGFCWSHHVGPLRDEMLRRGMCLGWVDHRGNPAPSTASYAKFACVFSLQVCQVYDCGHRRGFPPEWQPKIDAERRTRAR